MDGALRRDGGRVPRGDRRLKLNLAAAEAWLATAVQTYAGATIIVGRASEDASQSELIDAYNELDYHIMNSDRRRVEAYRRVLSNPDISGGKRCLDIGTGAFVTLPPFAIAGGASHIDAVEANPKSFALAQARIAADPQLRDRVTLHRSLSTDLVLPTKVDVVFHEIVGVIGSQEGMVISVADAQERLLAEGGRILPEQVETVIVPVEEPVIGPVSALVSWIGRGKSKLAPGPGLERLLNPSKRCRIGTPKVIEHFDFRPGARSLREQAVQESTVELGIQRDAAFAGFLMSCRVKVGPNVEPIDALDSITSWGAHFVRMTERPVNVTAGSNIRVHFRVDATTIDPTYTLAAELPDGRRPELEWNIATLKRHRE